jgi:hypothetical protein
MSDRDIRSYMALLRAAGGASVGDTVTLTNGRSVAAYSNVPIFRNQYIPINLGSGTNESTVFAGTLDDGSMEVGISGLTARGEAGIRVEDVGTSETKDQTVTRVKWYCGLANYNEKGLAALDGII